MKALIAGERGTAKAAATRLCCKAWRHTRCAMRVCWAPTTGIGLPLGKQGKQDNERNA